MKPLCRMAALVFLMALPILACNQPTSAQPTRPSGSVLFQDNFSNDKSGWDQISEADGSTGYDNGVYRIQVNTDNMDVWANPGLSFTDVQVEVDALKAGGNDDNDFGLICRYQDQDNYYQLIISSDGHYGIMKVQDGEQDLLGSESLLTSSAIRKGAATNHLRADCVGSSLTLYVNGEKVAETQDSTFPSGDVGLVAGTYEQPGTEIHFDNFTVTKP